MRLIFILFIFFSYLFGTNLVPIYYTMDDKSKFRKTFKVKNPSNSPVAVTFKVLQIRSIKNGKESRIKSPKIAYYPSNFVLAAKSTKDVRVNYLANTLPKAEETYRVIADELDIIIEDPDKKKPIGVNLQFQMRLSYEGLMFIKNPNSEMQLKINNFKELKRNKKFPKKRILNILIENYGYASGILTRKKSLAVKIKGKKYVLNISDLVGLGRSLARQKTWFLLKDITSLPNGKITKIYIVDKPKIIPKKIQKSKKLKGKNEKN